MHVTLHLTNACNLACGYCYECHQKDYMTAETAKKAALLAAGKGQSSCGIVFFGGEPEPESRCRNRLPPPEGVRPGGQYPHLGFRRLHRPGRPGRQPDPDPLRSAHCLDQRRCHPGVEAHRLNRRYPLYPLWPAHGGRDPDQRPLRQLCGEPERSLHHHSAG